MRNERILNFNTWQTLGKASVKLLSGFSKSSEECFGAAHISGMSEFGRVESAQIIRLPLKANLSLPPSGASAHDAFVRRLAPSTAATTTDVLGGCGLAKIAEAIVGGNTVDVIDQIGRPRPMHVKPDHAVKGAHSIADPNPKIPTARTARPDNRSLLSARTDGNAPRNNPGQWVISEELANQIRGYKGWVCGGRHGSEPTKQKQEQSNRNAARDRANKEGPESEREYIEHRLRELAAWERRIDGNKKRRV